MFFNMFFFYQFFFDAIASPCTYPSQWVSFRFWDCYRIHRACKLVIWKDCCSNAFVDQEMCMYWYGANPQDWRMWGWIWGFISIAGENGLTVRKTECDGATPRLWWKRDNMGSSYKYSTAEMYQTNLSPLSNKHFRILTGKLVRPVELLEILVGSGWRKLRLNMKAEISYYYYMM